MKTQNQSATAVIAMPSLTYALQGEAALSGRGIYVRVVKLPAGATKKGCAYGLELDSRRVPEATAILEGQKIKYGEILN